MKTLLQLILALSAWGVWCAGVAPAPQPATARNQLTPIAASARVADTTPLQPPPVRHGIIALATDTPRPAPTPDPELELQTGKRQLQVWQVLMGLYGGYVLGYGMYVYLLLGVNSPLVLGFALAGGLILVGALLLPVLLGPVNIRKIGRRILLRRARRSRATR